MTAPATDPTRKEQLQFCASLVTHYEDWTFAAGVAAQARGRKLELLALHAEQQAASSRALFNIARNHLVGIGRGTAGLTAEKVYDAARRYLASVRP